MQYTSNYNLMLPEGTDVVNLLTQLNPNINTIDAAMFANKQMAVGRATELTVGTVHGITRANTDSPIFSFTATSNWTTGDNMTVDGVTVTVLMSDGQTPKTGAYVINTEVIGIISGTRVTLLVSADIQGAISTVDGKIALVNPIEVTTVTWPTETVYQNVNTWTDLLVYQSQHAHSLIIMSGTLTVLSNMGPGRLDFFIGSRLSADKNSSYTPDGNTVLPVNYIAENTGIGEYVITLGMSGAVEYKIGGADTRNWQVRIIEIPIA